ncbi:MAG TPA: hypothetical protein VK809_03000 [Bacteroidia bacterium]|jgi:hypothetical protein|nr:hypothetical protein [Bacteroidia bacterium]
MKTYVDKLIAIDKTYDCLVPSEGWAPEKYNRFVELLENTIAELQQIIQELKAEKNPDRELHSQASLLLEKYLALQEEHYS